MHLAGGRSARGHAVFRSSRRPGWPSGGVHTGPGPGSGLRNAVLGAHGGLARVRRRFAHKIPDERFQRCYDYSLYQFKASQNRLSGGLPVNNLRLTWSSHVFWDAYFMHRALLEAGRLDEALEGVRFFMRTKEQARNTPWMISAHPASSGTGRSRTKANALTAHGFIRRSRCTITPLMPI